MVTLLGTFAACRFRTFAAFRQHLWRQATAEDRPHLPRSLKSLALALRSSTEGLLLLRRSKRAANLAELGVRLEDARDEVARFAPPFAALLDRVSEGTAALRAARGDDIAAERAQIEWLLDHGRIDAALTLCREWLVSLAASRLLPGEAIPGNYRTRKPFETFLNVLGGDERLSSEDVAPAHRPFLADPSFASFGTAWSQVRDIRNDLSHAGYNDNSKPGNIFARDAEAAIREALDLAPLDPEDP